MNNNPVPFQRKIILINPKFQWLFIAYTALISVVILSAFYGVFIFSFYKLNEMGIRSHLPPDHIYFEILRIHKVYLTRVLAGLFVFTSAILVFSGMIFSHRIAGPIYRMQTDLLNMVADQSGKIKMIHFRKKDFFKELAAAFNQFAESKNKDSNGR